MVVSLPVRSTKINGVDITSQANTWSDLQTFNDGITGSGNTGSLTAGSGILGNDNTWTAEQTFNSGITLPYFTGYSGASNLQIGSTADFNGNTQQFGIALPSGATNWAFQIFAGGGTNAYKQFYVSTFNEVGTKNNILDDGSGNMSIAGSLTVTDEATFNDGISINSDYDTGDYLGAITVTERQGIVSLGSDNGVTFDTGYDTMVIAITTGTIATTSGQYWYHLYPPVFMGLFKSGGYVGFHKNATYFWTSI